MALADNHKRVHKSYTLSGKADVAISLNKSMMFIECGLGATSFRLPSYYFAKVAGGLTSLLFLNKFLFVSFTKHFLLSYRKASMLYFVKLKLKGLGYRIRKVSSDLYYFFFNYTNMFYFYLPPGVLVKWYKKSIILLSNDFALLKMVFSHMLLLKELGPYRLRGVRYPRQIVMLKIKTKKA